MAGQADARGMKRIDPERNVEEAAGFHTHRQPSVL